MRKPRSALVCLLLLGFSVSLTVPVADNPETEYEESETLPFEATPLFTTVVQRASVRIAEAEPRNNPPLRFNSSTQRGQAGGQDSALPHRASDSITILNDSFRC